MSVIVTFGLPVTRPEHPEGTFHPQNFSTAAVDGFASLLL